MKKILFPLSILIVLAVAISSAFPAQAALAKLTRPGLVRDYTAIFVNPGKVAFDDGHEGIVQAGHYFYYFRWASRNLRYGCTTRLQSPSTCGVTLARNVRRIEP